MGIVDIRARLARAGFIAGLLLFGCAARVPPAAAQVTYTTPQTVKALIASNVVCTGSAQKFTTAQGLPNFRNLGQTQHYVSAFIGAAVGTVEIDGIDRNGNVFRISDVLSLGSGTTTNGAVTGTGSFDNFQVQITCTSGGTFTLTYAGTSATSNLDNGAYLFAQIDKVLFLGQNSGAPQSAIIQSPFGNAAGTIYIQFSAPAPTGATLSVLCLNAAGGNGVLPSPITNYSLPAVTIQQNINVPAAACPVVDVLYNGTGGAATGLVLEYVFNQPGAINNPPNLYTHIVGTTATPVNSSAGFLHNLTVNLGAAGTISILDLTASACTGTPTSPLIAKITATATTLQTFTYDVLATNGVCVQASAAMDITVSAHAP